MGHKTCFQTKTEKLGSNHMASVLPLPHLVRVDLKVRAALHKNLKFQAGRIIHVLVAIDPGFLLAFICLDVCSQNTTRSLTKEKVMKADKFWLIWSHEDPVGS